MTDADPVDNVEEAGAEDSPAAADEAARQFRAGAPHLLASSANVLGATTVDGDVVAGHKITINPAGELAHPLVTGPIPSGYLRRLVERFAEPPEYERLVRRLRIDRILVLRGSPDSGRRMASLRMLDQLLGEQGQLVVVDPAVPPGRIKDHLRPATGHLIADFAPSAESPLLQLHLHAAKEYLEEHEGYLILTVDTQAALDESLNELHPWQGPAAVDVLHAHLRATGDPARYEPAVELEETRAYLSATPSPAETAGFAHVLLMYVEGELTEIDLETYGAEAAEHLAQRLFADEGCSLRDKAFLIALAVFDWSPYPRIAEAGDALYLAFQSHENPEHMPGLSIFGAGRNARMELARAVEYDARTDGPLGARTRLAGFRYRAAWPIVLRHVWLNHPAAREPMVGWLRDLGEDSRPEVRVRAAVAAGCLAAVDFDTVRARLLSSWAGSNLIRQRQLAAWALSTAVDQGAEYFVRRLLRRWAEGSVAKRWTVTRTSSALADLLGRSALGILRTVAQAPGKDDQLERELVQTLGDILTGPLGRQTLGTLLTWSQADGPCRELAYQAFVHAAARRESPAAGPVLLELAATDPFAWRDHGALWRRILNGSVPVRDQARRRLAQWVVLAGPDPVLEARLGRLFADLVTTPNESARLDHLLRHLPADAPETARLLAERLRAQLPNLSAATAEL